MKQQPKIVTILVALTAVFLITSCDQKKTSISPVQSGQAETIAEKERLTLSTKGLDTSTTGSDAPSTLEQNLTIKDREGNDLSLPHSMEKIISLAPSTTEILLDLGLESKLVAVDKYSKVLLAEDNILPEFDVMNPDTEQLATLEADIIFATGMSRAKGEDPLKLLKDMGIVVTYIPTSESIAEIKLDIAFVAEVTQTVAKGNKLIQDMESTIEAYKEKAKEITQKKKVYFEIGEAPNLYSFGQDVFLNEIIELIGAENIFAKETSWIAVTPEAVVAANPDVILTNVNYMDNPVAEIKSRGGFAEISAVQNDRVYQIDNYTSSYANHNIVKAMEAMAQAIYPEVYSK